MSDPAARLFDLSPGFPRSNAAADKLYVMFCPMKKGSWLQTAPEVANPYYATDMKQCGEVKRTPETVAVR